MNVGLLDVSEEALLKWLQYEGGRILNMRVSPEMTGVIEIKLEHSDMPKVIPGVYLTHVTPVYTRYQDGEGHFVNVRSKQ